MKLKLRFLIIAILFSSHAIFAQFAKVAHIAVEGNKKTRVKTILRELNFAIGDSIPIEKLGEVFERNRLQIMNTNIFSSVVINAKDWDYTNNKITVHIKVAESWYLIPYAYAELADRNFNIWWDEKNKDLTRLFYYGGLKWYNPTGSNDNLKAFVQFGFGKKLALQYTLPNLGRKNNLGLIGSVELNRNKEIWYNTRNDSLQYFVDESQASQNNLQTYLGLTYRHQIRSTHRIRLQYTINHVSDIIAKEKNPEYLSNGTSQRYFSLEYKYIHDRRNLRAYPTKGSYYFISAEKQGLLNDDNVNALYLSSLYAKYISLSTKTSIECIGKFRYETTREKQPYYNIRAFGYGRDYLRGYEYYVVDGTDFIYLKTSVRYKFIDKIFSYGRLVPEKNRYVPVKVLLTVNNDVGRVQNPYALPSNRLPNQWLWGKGLGLDFIFYQGAVAQIEYSFSHYEKGALYLHLKTVLD